MHEDTSHAERGVVPVLTADRRRALGEIPPRPLQHRGQLLGRLEFQLEEGSGGCGLAGSLTSDAGQPAGQRAALQELLHGATE